MEGQLAGNNDNCGKLFISNFMDEIMKTPKILLALLFCITISGAFTACNENPASTTPQILKVEVTRIVQVSSIPQAIWITQEVTHETTIGRTVEVEVTPTPEPMLAKDCFDSAMTQVELNGCANYEYQLALKELDKIIAQINIPEKDMQELERIQAIWQKQMEYECDFFTSRTITDENGDLHYIGGSMAPMNRGFCMANRTKERIKELQLYFLYSPGQ